MASQPMLSGDARRYASGQGQGRYNENRPPVYSILCRNGPKCKKWQEGTCSYNHDFSQMPPPNGVNVPKKSLNVESPSFTPKPLSVQQSKSPQSKGFGLSPKAAGAAVFTPRVSATVTPAGTSHSKQSSGEFVPQQNFQPTPQINEFIPQSFQAQPPVQPQIADQINAFNNDSFFVQPGLGTFDQTQQAAINPYAQQAPAVGAQAYFQDASVYKQPLNYHLYASIGPHRENLMAYQRSTSDFFIPDNIREDLQKKSEATLQTFANSTLPANIEYFHSLVALDTTVQRGPSIFGYPSHVYKATSGKDGHHYVLRRVEGFRLTDADAIKTVQAWKRVSCGSVVQVHDAFTTRVFGDSSLIVVTDYHPNAQTLFDKHFNMARHTGGRGTSQIVPENDLWGYIVQLANALKTIHTAGLAARTIQSSKILQTSKNRLRLNGCGVLDVTQFEQPKPLAELQQTDLQNLGQLILSIAVRNPTAHHNISKSLEQVSRTYTERLRACLAWLLNPPSNALGKEVESLEAEYDINIFLTNIADKIVAVMDSTLHQADETTAQLMRELENGRLVRLLTKLNIILERPDSSAPSSTAHPQTLNQPSNAWSETGERYYLKLFRDYVFHQVDHEGRPVLDLGHVIACLNKLDAGIEERVQLVSRNEQDVFIMSFREIKRGLEAAWAEISKSSTPSRR